MSDVDILKITFYNHRWWKTGDRVNSQPFGRGTILRFANVGGVLRAIVRFDNATVGTSWADMCELENLS